MKTINWKHATPEQLNFWDYLNTIFHITAIVPLYYQGTIAGSEFLIYDPAKIYLALELNVNGAHAAVNDILANIQITGVDDLDIGIHYENNPYWDTTAASIKLTSRTIFLKNFYFHRFIVAQFLYMKFNGYRLTIA